MKESVIAVRIIKKLTVCDSVFEFVLAPANGDPLPKANPGDHIDVYIDADTVRQYSLMNAPGESDYYRIGVLCDEAGRGGSRTLCSQFKVDDILSIGQPRNLFALKNGGDAILIAGGIGITPVASMAYALQSQGRNFQFHYLNRSQSRAAFLPELKQAFGDSLHTYFDDQQQTLDCQVLFSGWSAGCDLYVCGPEGLIQFVKSQAIACGWPEASIHFELFSRTEPSASESGEFQLVIDDTEEVISVAPEESALEALQRSGFDIPCSCEQGICGSCVLEVVEGQPEHNDMFFTDAERLANNKFTPCCSRSLSKSLRIRLSS